MNLPVSLNREQTKILGNRRQTWFEVATRRGVTDRKRAERAISTMYRLHKKSPPSFLWCPSPLSGALMIASLLDPAQERPTLGGMVRDVSRGSLKQYPQSILDEVIPESLRDYKLDLLRSSMAALLGPSLNFSRGITIKASPEFTDYDGMRLAEGRDKHLEGLLDLTIGRTLKGWLDESLAHLGVELNGDIVEDRATRHIPWMAFCDSLELISDYTLGANLRDYLTKWSEVVESCFWWWSFEKVVIISERPPVLQVQPFEGRYLFHAEKGPALAFKDGWQVYALHGVRVPPEVVKDSPKKLDARLVITQTNADVKREIVRKIGIERVCADLGAKVTDSSEAYQLLLLDLGDTRQRPFLRMLNPSTGTWHIEGVGPNCRTVEEALEWRNGTDIPPAILS